MALTWRPHVTWRSSYTWRGVGGGLPPTTFHASYRATRRRRVYRVTAE